jgi:hypothetical protein
MKHLLIELAKLLLKMAMDKALRKALPRVYAQLDADLPQVLAMKPAPIVVESVVAQSIAQATGNRASVSQIEAVIGLYDPMRAALRNLKR